MKVSYNWLKDYMNFSHSPEEIGDILTSIGLEVEGMEVIEPIPGGLQGVRVGHILSCDKHPNADRLSVTTVDVGAEEPLQIVCGAPNVATGQKVPVATVGTLLHPTEGEPFKIKKGKIRGEVSLGMICAEDELGLGTSHEGIMILDPNTPVGIPLKQALNLSSDVVYDIGLTPNRPDAVAHMGVAKDLFAALRTNYDYKQGITLPQSSEFKITDPIHSFTVSVENHKACPRYTGIVITNIQNTTSPDWLITKLKSIGVKTINAVVDITNYILHEYGQPLHAFDLEQIKGEGIIVKTLQNNHPFTSLDGVERKLTDQDLMICDATGNPMCIAGVYGGLHSGVKSETTSIFLESAHFNAEWIRRTSMHHQLRTDAAKVYEKGSDPNICLEALKKATELIVQLTHATVSSDIIDIYPNPKKPAHITITYSQIEKQIGISIPPAKIIEILTDLDITILNKDDQSLEVSVPTNKPDVTRPADLVEEILRIYGFNKIPVSDKISMSSLPLDPYQPWDLQQEVSKILAAQGLQESMGLSMTENKYIPTHIDPKRLVQVNNTSNIHLSIMRPSMISTALQAIQHNQNRQQRNLRFFEFGRVYEKSEEGYHETEQLAIYMTGAFRPPSWHEPEHNVHFYYLKSIALQVLQFLGFRKYQISKLDDPLFSYGQKVHLGNHLLLKFGEINISSFTDQDTKDPLFYAEFDWANCLALQPKKNSTYSPISKFPGVDRDLSLLVPNRIAYEDIERLVRSSAKPILKDIQLVDIYQSTEMKKEMTKSYSLRLRFENTDRTLTDKEIDNKISKILSKLDSDLNIKLRSS